MSTLDDVEKELQAAIRAKKRERERARTDEAAPPKLPAGPNLGEVFDYLYRVRNWPRQLLESRLVAEFGVAPRLRSPREYLVQRLVLERHARFYAEHPAVEVPATFARRCGAFRRYERPAPVDDERAAREEPAEPTFDPCAVAVAAAPNPFERNVAWTSFSIVELAGATGIARADLAGKLAGVTGVAVDKADARADLAFTAWVDKGWTKIRWTDLAG